MPRTSRSLKADWELLWAFVRTDLRLRTREMRLGAAWQLILPFSQILVYYFAFRYVLAIQAPQFALFLTLGIVHWNLMSTVMGSAPGAVIRYGQLIDKVAFPRTILAYANVGTHLAQHGFMLVCLAILFVPFGGAFWWGHIAYVPVLAMLLVFLVGMSLLLSSLTVYLRDIESLTTIGLVILFWMSPVVYDFQNLPERWQYVFSLNPLSTYFDGVRYVLLHNRFPVLGHWTAMAGWSLIALLVGHFSFRRLEPGFTERA